MTDYSTMTEEQVRTGNGHAVRPGFAGLLGRFADETRTLLLLEVKLAKSELNEKIGRIERAASTLSTGAAVLYAGVLALTFSAIAALALIVDVWLSALIVGGTATILGAIMMAAGRARLKKENLEMTQTKKSLQEGKQWVKSQMP